VLKGPLDSLLDKKSLGTWVIRSTIFTISIKRDY